MKIPHADRAKALVGCRFRPQGRNARTGLDCLGVVLETFGIAADAARADYLFRGDHGGELKSGLLVYFRRISMRQLRSGDLLLLRAAADQFHLAVKSDAGFIHADAGLRKVVETPGAPRWPVIAMYRRRSRPPRKELQWPR
ncbi:MAG: peptidoglycan endopeptidase [Pseudomonadota bacterium]|nr:peptidoglycan endopeptidase [Pseudomonadota bacterium]